MIGLGPRWRSGSSSWQAMPTLYGSPAAGSCSSLAGGGRGSVARLAGHRRWRQRSVARLRWLPVQSTGTQQPGRGAGDPRPGPLPGRLRLAGTGPGGRWQGGAAGDAGAGPASVTGRRATSLRGGVLLGKDHGLSAHPRCPTGRSCRRTADRRWRGGRWWSPPWPFQSISCSSGSIPSGCFEIRWWRNPPSAAERRDVERTPCPREPWAPSRARALEISGRRSD